MLAIFAGELKHGPLGLVEGGTPILIIASKDATYQVSRDRIMSIFLIFIRNNYC